MPESSIGASDRALRKESCGGRDPGTPQHPAKHPASNIGARPRGTHPDEAVVVRQILDATRENHKSYGFDEGHDPTAPAEYWFQESHEGPILFVVFFTQACRWSRCLGCNLPSRMASRHIPCRDLMAQVDTLLASPDVVERTPGIRKVIVSNNGSVLDEITFSSTAMMYLVARLNQHLPELRILSFETRPEYVDLAELEFLGRSLAEGRIPATLELAVGFEALDDRIRNEVFDKGLKLEQFERLAGIVAPYGFRLKCYFMLKPVPDLTDDEAVYDLHRAIDYLSGIAERYGVAINLHLNPTYAAKGTPLETAFRNGEWTPPRLVDVARAALHAKGLPLTVFIGLSDEALACPGGSFRTSGDEAAVADLETFNRTQDFAILERFLGGVACH